MKRLNTKLSSKRRIAAHLLTTSAIAILGAQSAAAVTVVWVLSKPMRETPTCFSSLMKSA